MLFFSKQTTAYDIQLSGANTTGNAFSPEIDFNDVRIGNSWGTVTWHDVQTVGTILYHVQYLDSTSTWELVPDSDLPGNAAGTSTQPINIAGLDPNTYSAI